jgi:hypothetical protein
MSEKTGTGPGRSANRGASSKAIRRPSSSRGMARTFARPSIGSWLFNPKKPPS